MSKLTPEQRIKAYETALKYCKIYSMWYMIDERTRRYGNKRTPFVELNMFKITEAVYDDKVREIILLFCIELAKDAKN